ncbi:efflux transporter, outer membrane factor (OMF) lipoprotein, NodT family [Malonomonas rubra DSM 5091]|uniref:Efflux transporter, outer membrane factor (OMF) lipoprotein, NodT family n=1 Tax=Malonomonas rubra DSM 5091 TaxID=1122189 RepID=A0A1M6IQA7_MALRU|nr:efflux transporter outer membrane subunit [Malonomonas rubra]SHJ36622.1 efflux transporter, outer membrane factor (OMF) lipoprotein, NodT family [Malonomonas rubra DSM 5091]
MRWNIPGLLLLLFLNACSPFRVELQPQEMVEPPQNYSTVGSEVVPGRWWQSFASADLDRLIDEALNDNLTLRQAWARLLQAQSLSRQSRSSQRPDLSLSAGHENSRQRSSGMTTDDESYSLGLSSSFELDLWGRVAAEVESQQKEELATREDLQTAAISLAAEVTDSWLSLLTQIGQQQLLDQQLQTSREYLRLIDLRFRKSQSTALDLLQQQEAIAALQTRLPALQKQEQLLRHELALLLGNSPQQPLVLTEVTLPQLHPLPALGLPADLLRQRPDVRAAALRLQAAGLDLTVAKADRLPALKLTASATTSGDFSELFDNWLLNLAQNLSAPLLDSGKRKAEVERQKAVLAEEVAGYQQSVLTAIREVEDALVSEQKLQEELNALLHQLEIAKKALAVAKNRYLKGQSTYLPVLTELQNVEQLQQDLLNQRLDLLSNRVSLHRALGGDWSEQLPVQQLEVKL